MLAGRLLSVAYLALAPMQPTNTHQHMHGALTQREAVSVAEDWQASNRTSTLTHTSLSHTHPLITHSNHTHLQINVYVCEHVRMPSVFGLC